VCKEEAWLRTPDTAAFLWCGQQAGKKHTKERAEADGNETVTRRALTGDEAEAAVLRDAPELLALLAELRANLSEVRHRVGPLLQQVRGVCVCARACACVCVSVWPRHASVARRQSGGSALGRGWGAGGVLPPPCAPRASVPRLETGSPISWRLAVVCIVGYLGVHQARLPLRAAAMHAMDALFSRHLSRAVEGVPVPERACGWCRRYAAASWRRRRA
jgi:hypothetical protein